MVFTDLISLVKNVFSYLINLSLLGVNLLFEDDRGRSLFVNFASKLVDLLLELKDDLSFILSLFESISNQFILL